MVEDFKKLKKELERLKKKAKKVKLSNKKLQNKKIFKKSDTTVTIKEREVPSVLGDPNRFFKDEWEEAKKAMFFK